jgi:putative tryptophan/tyrosine transport system substrate-binding protein
MAINVARRKFIAALGGASFAWPLAARAQQTERVRRIGVLMLYPENDPAGQVRAAAFRQGLEKLGWTIGRDLQIDFHWGTGDVGWIRGAVAELMMRVPDLILANSSETIAPVQQATRTLPVIFIGGGDPVADGFVQSLARPGGNLTGFTVLEPSIGAKWLELLKQIAPDISRVAVLVNPDSLSSKRLSAWAADAAPKFAVEVEEVPVREPADIEAAMAARRSGSHEGLIIPADPVTNSQRKLIVDLAARYRLPAIYGLRAAPGEGGLMSYGVDLPNLFREAAVYADRILKGEKPANLPVQQPTKFEFVINLKTTKALGLTVPQSLLASARRGDRISLSQCVNR